VKQEGQQIEGGQQGGEVLSLPSSRVVVSSHQLTSRAPWPSRKGT
jgi:hypothetical protein